jgi:hypothetical protein
MDDKEMTDVIYDTLMQNKQHEQLDLNKVEDPKCERKRGWITFDYGDRIVYINLFTMPR